jgi:hypothetical protein
MLALRWWAYGDAIRVGIDCSSVTEALDRMENRQGTILSRPSFPANRSSTESPRLHLGQSRC